MESTLFSKVGFTQGCPSLRRHQGSWPFLEIEVSLPTLIYQVPERPFSNARPPLTHSASLEAPPFLRIGHETKSVGCSSAGAPAHTLQWLFSVLSEEVTFEVRQLALNLKKKKMRRRVFPAEKTGGHRP